jgi:hypothetical protein
MAAAVGLVTHGCHGASGLFIFIFLSFGLCCNFLVVYRGHCFN